MVQEFRIHTNPYPLIWIHGNLGILQLARRLWEFAAAREEPTLVLEVGISWTGGKTADF